MTFGISKNDKMDLSGNPVSEEVRRISKNFKATRRPGDSHVDQIIRGDIYGPKKSTLPKREKNQ